jgi:hypothetical protein
LGDVCGNDVGGDIFEDLESSRFEKPYEVFNKLINDVVALNSRK